MAGNLRGPGASDSLRDVVSPAYGDSHKAHRETIGWQNADAQEGGILVKLGWKQSAFVALLALSFGMNPIASAQQGQSSVPNAPAPQALPPLSSVGGPITPGKGTGEVSSSPAPTQGGPSSSANQRQTAPVAPPPPPPPSQPPFNQQKTPPEEGAEALGRIVMNVNQVEVPVTVKDSQGNLVSGLTWRDFQVFENGQLQNLSVFSRDPQPLSIAFVIDQSLPSDVMDKVNQSLGAIQGALTPYDEAAVFTYSNGAKEWTGFTGAQSNRLPAVLALAKATGSDMLVPVNTGPMANCPIYVNGNCPDPNIQSGRSTGDQTFSMIPKEIHTLNDAILAAAKELSTRPKDRRRIIYVISDGKEYGSKASIGEVIKFLQTNKIAVFGTLVGDSARWGEGFISKLHIPFTMYDNVLYRYTTATGGDLDAQNGVNGIEKSYATIANEARNQYTLSYLSHESIYDGRYRSIEVRVNRPNLDVICKKGYYPSGQDAR